MNTTPLLYDAEELHDLAPGAREAGVWLYNEILPQGRLGEAEAALVMRVLAIAQAPDPPVALVQGLWEDVQEWLSAIPN